MTFTLQRSGGEPGTVFSLEPQGRRDMAASIEVAEARVSILNFKSWRNKSQKISFKECSVVMEAKNGRVVIDRKVDANYQTGVRVGSKVL